MNRGRRTFLTVAGLGAVATAATSALGRLGEQLRAAGASTPVRWAMVVDPLKCLKAKGCRDCTQACHQVHNVPSIADPRHEVKWIWKARVDKVFPSDATLAGIGNQDSGFESSRPVGREEQTPESRLLAPDADLIVLCNHCDNPPCVRVCPTKATWKREDGIVMMDPHRCIGCRYCMAACPYGARSFNWDDPRPHLAARDPRYPARTKGVVEKCTFCEERLATGERPACVEACKEKALVFGDLNDTRSEVRRVLGRQHTIRRRPELGTRPQVYYLI